MKTKAIFTLIALTAAMLLPSCTAIVDPTPEVTTRQATTTTTDPYTGTSTYRKTTTTNY